MSDFLQKTFGISLDLYSVLIVWGLIFTRTITMIALNPFLGSKGTPAQIRIITAFVLTTFAYFMLYGYQDPVLPEQKMLLVVYFFKELFFGAALGLTTILCFYAIEAGGRIVDNQRGSANAQVFVPALGQVSLYGLFYYWLGLTIFLSLSGHVPFLKAYLEGFQLVNVMSLPNLAPGASPFLNLFLRMSADVLILGMQLASPILIAVFLTDLVLGIANKMAPQIPVFELGFLLKGYVGSAMVAVSIFALSKQMGSFFDVMNGNVVRVIQTFAP